MSKKILFIGWVLWSVLILSLMFILVSVLTTSFWIMFSFVLLALLIFLVLLLYELNSNKDRQFTSLSKYILTGAYVAIMSVLGIVVSVFSDLINYKIVLSVNLVITILFTLLYIGMIAGGKHITKIDSRQKHNHVEL